MTACRRSTGRSILDVGGTLAVDAVSGASALNHTQYIALARQGCDRRPVPRAHRRAARVSTRASVDPHRTCACIANVATLSLDLSGMPLHRRGWRRGQGEAPLKENLAGRDAAARRLARSRSRPAGALVDPMCGSGDAADRRRADGGRRRPGAAARLLRFSRLARATTRRSGGARRSARSSARDTGLRALQPVVLRLRQRSARARTRRRRNAQAAGVAGFVQLARQDVEHLHRAGRMRAAGLVVCNPPYGERLGERGGAAARSIARSATRLRAEFPAGARRSSRSTTNSAHALGLRARQALCAVQRRARMPAAGVRSRRASEPRERVERAVVGRRRIGRQPHREERAAPAQAAAEEAIGCYRIYDADLPEYAAAIDVYTAVAGEGDRPARPGCTFRNTRRRRDIPEHAARDRLRDLVRAAARRARGSARTHRAEDALPRQGRLEVRASSTSATNSSVSRRAASASR